MTVANWKTHAIGNFTTQGTVDAQQPRKRTVTSVYAPSRRRQIMLLPLKLRE
jgi:hypothetical protein